MTQQPTVGFIPPNNTVNPFIYYPQSTDQDILFQLNRIANTLERIELELKSHQKEKK